MAYAFHPSIREAGISYEFEDSQKGWREKPDLTWISVRRRGLIQRTSQGEERACQSLWFADPDLPLTGSSDLSPLSLTVSRTTGEPALHSPRLPAWRK